MVDLSQTQTKRYGKSTKEEKARTSYFVLEDGCIYQKLCLKGEIVITKRHVLGVERPKGKAAKE